MQSLNCNYEVALRSTAGMCTLFELLQLTEVLGDVGVGVVVLGSGDLPVEGVARVPHAKLELDGLVGHPLVDHRGVHHAREEEELLTTPVGRLKSGTRTVSQFAIASFLRIFRRKRFSFFFQFLAGSTRRQVVRKQGTQGGCFGKQDGREGVAKDRAE